MSVNNTQSETMIGDPVMLYCRNIHHSHEAMAESINADVQRINQGNVLQRVQEAYHMDYSGRTVITEGAAPLFTAAWMKKFGNAENVIHLAADESLMNIVEGVDHYSTLDTLAHKWAHKYVDSVLAVSPRLLRHAKEIGIHNTHLIHPFPTEDMWRELGLITKLTHVNIEDSVEHTIVSVGSNREKNGYDIIPAVIHALDHDVTWYIIGPETETLYQEHDSIEALGFVDQDVLLDTIKEATAFVLPAKTQPFPTSVIEALRSGTPPVVTNGTGNHPYVSKVDPNLVTTRNPTHIANAIENVFNKTESEYLDLTTRSRGMADYLSPETGVEAFRHGYVNAVKQTTNVTQR